MQQQCFRKYLLWIFTEQFVFLSRSKRNLTFLGKGLQSGDWFSQNILYFCESQDQREPKVKSAYGLSVRPAWSLSRFLQHKTTRSISTIPMDGMLVPICTWVKKGTVKVKCLSQEQNRMSLSRVLTWTARSGVELTNHEPGDHNPLAHQQDSIIPHRHYVAKNLPFLLRSILQSDDSVVFGVISFV